MAQVKLNQQVKMPKPSIIIEPVLRHPKLSAPTRGNHRKPVLYFIFNVSMGGRKRLGGNLLYIYKAGLGSGFRFATPSAKEQHVTDEGAIEAKSEDESGPPEISKQLRPYVVAKISNDVRMIAFQRLG